MVRPKYKDQTAPIIIGVDPARFGADATVIAVRQGRDIVRIDRHRGDDTMTVVGHIIEAIEEFKPALVVIDEGGLGAGIVDRLKEQRYKIKGVNFGNKSSNPIMYGNKRAEMWGKMKDWLRSASIPKDRFLKTDLVSPMIKPDSKGTIFLESKKDMKARGLASPDAADAIAGLERDHVQAQAAQAVELVQPGKPGPDNDGVAVRAGCCTGCVRVCACHRAHRSLQVRCRCSIQRIIALVCHGYHLVRGNVGHLIAVPA
jgi:hypothetical protein